MNRTLILAAALAAAPAAAAQTSLSIYGDGRVVVRKTLAQALKAGRTDLLLNDPSLDPATLFSPDSSVTVSRVAVLTPSTADEALARAVGRTLAFVRAKGDTVQATVINVQPPQYRLADGRLLLQLPGTPLFPAEEGIVRTSAQAAITLDAARARPQTALAWVTAGATWRATYEFVLGGGRVAVSGAATIASQGLRADSAEISLVAGSIARANPPAAPAFEAARMGALAAGNVEAPAEEAVGETHVYQLAGRVSLAPGATTTVGLFPRAVAPVEREFIIPGVLPWRGYFSREPSDPNAVPVQVWYTVKRARGTGFGDRPLPAGVVEIFQPDSSGRVQLVGEATIGHTPAGKDVRVRSGDAFDVTAERLQTDFSQEQLPPEQRGLPSRTRVTAAYRVTITNAKDEAVTVDVREKHFGTWRVVASSVPAEKLSSTESRFRVSVPANGSATLTYTVQVDS